MEIGRARPGFAIIMTLHYFDADRLPATSWKNGGGTTREIACHPAGAGIEDFGWRVSIADIAADGPFSPFPGIDRVITLLDGPGVRLYAPDAGIDHRLDRPLAPFAFPGEAAIESTLLGGATADFNVMTRRGQWHAEVRVPTQATELQAAPGGLLYAARGAWRVHGNGTDCGLLQPGGGLYWREEGGHALRLEPETGDAALIAVRFTRG